MNEITHRIKKILSYYNLNAADFSKKVGVQKSSMSHLLSGRNKPSFDFINKLSEAFPDINIRWFITGKGNFLLDSNEKTQDNTGRNDDFLHKEMPEKSLSNIDSFENNITKELFEKNMNSIKEVSLKQSEHIAPKEIIMVYSDNTFIILKSR